MCLYPKMSLFRKLFNMKPKIRIAKKDIKVYKFLLETNKGLFSAYYTFQWELNTLKKSNIVLKKRNSILYKKIWKVDEGFHSYINPCTNDPYLAYNDLYNAIIPKGSRYIVGKFGDIVSDQLIITSKYNNGPVV